MPKAAPAFTGFTAGQLSPRMDGRTDFDKYYQGCKTLDNFLVHPHGGASRRPGAIFVAEVKDHTKAVRLIPFEFNVTQTYMLEFGEYYIRFYKDGGTITSGGNPYEISTPYTESDLDEIKFTQSADVMYICHPEYPVKKLTRTDHTAWTLTDVEFNYGPMMDQNLTETYLFSYNGSNWSDRATGQVHLGSFTKTTDNTNGQNNYEATIVGINNDTGFKATDQGRIIQVHDGFVRAKKNTGTNANPIVNCLLTKTWSSYNSSNNQLTLNSTSNVPNKGIVRVGDELIYYGGLTNSPPNTLTNVVRAYGGTSQGSPSGGDTVEWANVIIGDVLENPDGRTELTPEYRSTGISTHEGDPSGTGLEHNDRMTDQQRKFVTEGFKENMFIEFEVGHASNYQTLNTWYNNDKWPYLIVKCTDDTILLAPSDQLGTYTNAQLNSASSPYKGSRLAGYLGENDGTQQRTVNGVVNYYYGTDIEANRNWALGAFSDTTGYPRAVTFYEERLVFAGTNNNPQTIFFSASGDFENFQMGTADADAIVYTIGSNEVNVIRYMASGSSLIIGTSGGEFAIQASGTDAPVTPTNIQIKKQANYGSANIQPANVGNVTLFVQRARRKIRELVYSFDTNSYEAPDMTILAENITETGIKSISHMQEPDNILWCVLNNGQLAGMTYRREESVIAWHNHKFGGSWVQSTSKLTSSINNSVTTIPVGSTADFASTGTIAIGSEQITYTGKTATSFTGCTRGANSTTAVAHNSGDAATVLNAVTYDWGVVESVAAIPGVLDEDQLYLSIKRTINGETKRYIERLNYLDFGDKVNDAYFVDSGLSYYGSAASSFTGAVHLAGQTVNVLADGAAHPQVTVDNSGAFSLNRNATSVHIGFPYTSTLQTMRVEAGAAQGTAQGRPKRIHDVSIRVYRSVGLKIGQNISVSDIVPFRSAADEMDQALPLFTGDKTIEFSSGYDTDGFIFVTQDQPLPLTVLALYPRLQTYEE
tara:strand:+ start:10087 stop:13047 length:2961 start_codon:yes stop_codon:yes gene_type:complete